MSKRKRHIRGNLQRELWNIFYKIRPSDILVQYQKYINIICGLLHIKPPEVRFCDSSRQGECIVRHNGKDLCGGACYNHAGIIYLRNHYMTQDTILHEIFHHINQLNTDVQEKIMWDWLYHQTAAHKMDFRKVIKDALKYARW